MVSNYVVWAENEGLRLQSGPGRDLIFKVTGEDTGGALWESQGTLIAPGWLFVESDTVDVP